MDDIDESIVYTGVIKGFNQDKGWGHISCQETYKTHKRDIFVLRRQCQGHVEVGDTVDFQIRPGKRAPQAFNVNVVEEGGSRGPVGDECISEDTPALDDLIACPGIYVSEALAEYRGERRNDHRDDWGDDRRTDRRHDRRSDRRGRGRSRSRSRGGGGGGVGGGGGDGRGSGCDANQMTSQQLTQLIAQSGGVNAALRNALDVAVQDDEAFLSTLEQLKERRPELNGKSKVVRLMSARFDGGKLRAFLQPSNANELQMEARKILVRLL
eukprot:TRINITY_DN38311_c0_g4_i1.p1 TRINITY_DN38311_c0_g4~~TRINITY_DN38311_c0_g4_i1.p1  ORF type:complete len:268 (+),score=35.63 TRINITY_DN38311_c0_g4_i1:164-967(+)